MSTTISTSADPNTAKGASPADSAAVAAVAEVVLGILREKYEAPADTTTADTEFDMLGFDSLVLVEVAVDLSSRFGIEISDEVLHEAGTTARAARVLVEAGARV
ncbi:acyl carrier protein [Streptomyces sp. WMMC940]|uniref:acyl carrier protein n=1 Tax=Streptomyces sp. WMMC940 TaxID=3015153 RepID=UPI0022B65EC4|nr:acyl carrier protein [Streptomyces sp. WMMC940]MCZ7459561.1 acyl carrier protein [Streptomyces sp. WMMC940]